MSDIGQTEKTGAMSEIALFQITATDHDWIARWATERWGKDLMLCKVLPSLCTICSAGLKSESPKKSTSAWGLETRMGSGRTFGLTKQVK
jgi:hypothetical protein